MDTPPNRRSPLLPAMFVWLAACADRPVAVDSETTTSVSSSASSSGDLPGTPTTTDPAPTDSAAGSDETTGDPATFCGPCPVTWESESDVDITPDTDLAQFACLGAVNGKLTVAGHRSASELAALASLTRVTGYFSFGYNAKLTDLAPLSCLREVDLLDLSELPNLTDASALANLEHTRFIGFTRTGIVALPAFAPGFHGLESVSFIDNVDLIDVSAAAGWHAAPDDPDPQKNMFGVLNSPALTSLDGFQELAQVLDILGVEQTGITSLTGLETLAGDHVHLTLRDLPALASLDGLEGLTGGDLWLENLPLVPDIESLTGIEEMIGLTIDRLPLVQSLTPLADLRAIDQLVLAALPNVPTLAPLAKLESVPWRLSIGSCSDGLDGITDLTGLGSLKWVRNLQIGNNDNLASLAGADGLLQLQYLDADNNPKLDPAAIDALSTKVAPPAQLCSECDLCSTFH